MSGTKRKWITALMLVAAVTSAWLVAAQPGPTAKAALAKAKATAQAWQADAALYELTSPDVGPDGRTPAGSSWQLTFYSATARKPFMVVVSQTVVGVPRGGPYQQMTIDDFVDSGEALAEAKKNGFAPKGRVSMRLGATFAQPLTQKLMVWTIVDESEAMPKHFYIVDPNTGKFVGKT